MNPLRMVCLAACLLVATATPSGPALHANSISNNLRPSNWVSPAQLENLPALNEISFEQLENMSSEDGANLIDSIYHLAQVNRVLTPSYVPNPRQIPGFIVSPSGQKVNFNLDTFVATAKQQPNFGNEEVTIFITGLPQKSATVSKATQKLVEAYMQRYNGVQSRQQQSRGQFNDYGNQYNSESDENENRQSNQQRPTGNLVVINMGAALENFEEYAQLNVEETGAMFGKVLVQMTNEINVPEETVHIVAQGIAAQVAGAAARTYTRLTGHQLRRITALDPSRIFAKNANTLSGLARGAAQFVDAIHTSAYGMGTPKRVGNVDFYPNGPSVAVPGARNIIEASMRATRYYAETVRPGNERDFPAVAASSLQQYKNNNGHGKRAYMGIDADYDLEGDYILQVNAKGNFGRMAPAKTQNSYHNAHQPWNSNNQGQNQRNSNNNA